MSSRKGIIALMGSGELTATMVEVHKELLAGLAGLPQAVFLDTPAGFQLNVDEISQKAVEYFYSHVQQSMTIASFKSRDGCSEYEREQAYHMLREANFVLIGPGSPSYAVRQWQQTPIPNILIKQVEHGGCLVAASAAALTVGRFTIPVYEIYKVGESLHWVEGMNILEHFGFNLVVVPHWNNAEGGTHDTQCCFMGRSRFQALEALLPGDVSIFGLDEHTACLMDLEKEEAIVKGIGRATLRRQGKESIFESGDRFPLDVLRGKRLAESLDIRTSESSDAQVAPDTQPESFWQRIHAIQDAFHAGLDKHEGEAACGALLELDRAIWQAKQELEHEEFISQAREVLRDLIVVLGMRLASSPKDRDEVLAPLVDEILLVRERFRKNQQWQEADEIRNSLQRAGILIEDTATGPQWRLGS